jgi:2-oxoglutarate ferredoxin oxidoreductase subunit delta
MAHVVFRTDKCKGCSMCVKVCPKQILALDKDTVNAKGYNPCHCVDESKCIGCAFCATMCPDVVIDVFR